VLPADRSIPLVGDWMIKPFVVSQDWIDGVHRARLDRWAGLPRRVQVFRYDFGKKFRFYAVCESCQAILLAGDHVLEFRSDRFVHETLGCIDRLSPFSITHELRNLVSSLYPVREI
jgi:hypothetical protein